MGSTGGGQFGENGQKLHENDKIGIFWSKQWGDMGGQANFSGSGGGGSPHLSPPTWGNPADACITARPHKIEAIKEMHLLLLWGTKSR